MRILKLFLYFIIGVLAIQSFLVSIILGFNALGVWSIGFGSLGNVGVWDYLVPVILISSIFYFLFL